jgi:hypothetical protein
VTSDRRLAQRHAQKLQIDLHVKGARQRLQAFDVSRHGLFVGIQSPPPVNHAVLLTVHLQGGPFDTMATVVRRNLPERGIAMGLDDKPIGMGVKLYCLSAEAKVRWDRFVLALEHPEVALPTRPTPHNAACFLVQLPDTSSLLDFFLTNVVGGRTLYVSPAMRKVGGEVQVVLVHPFSHDEFALSARVVEWNPDRPLRMGIKFEGLTRDVRRKFKGFLGPVPGSDSLSMPDGMPLLPSERPQWTEYAFFSPKLKNGLAPPKGASLPPQEPILEPVLLDEVHDLDLAIPIAQTQEELDTIEGEMLDLPELELVDKKALFDFTWNNDGGDDPV